MVVIMPQSAYVSIMSTHLLQDSLQKLAQHRGESPGRVPGDFGEVCSLCTCAGVMCGGVMLPYAGVIVCTCAGGMSYRPDSVYFRGNHVLQWPHLGCHGKLLAV